jgi:methylase of polypeptide subunit release factors
MSSALFQLRGRDIRIDTASDGAVLFPTDVGLSLLQALNLDLGIVVDGARVLDVGCGSGLYTVAMLSAGAAHVTALDVNRGCLDVTLANVARNGLDTARVTTTVADLAQMDVIRPWDLVVCNPPHLPHDEAYASGDGIESALVGGDDGRALYDVLLTRLDELLVVGGTLLLAHSSLAHVDRTVRELSAAGYRVRTVQICDMDIPLRRYAQHRNVLVSRLYGLREAGRATFRGLRFEVHALAATRMAPAGEEVNR